MAKRRAHHRFAAWVSWYRENHRDESGKEPSLEAVAAVIGCSQGFVSQLLSGTRSAELESAHKIERVTARWPDGPIRTEEWIVSRAARATRKRLPATGTDGRG